MQRSFLCHTQPIGWLSSRVISMLDCSAEGPGFKSQSRRCQVSVLGKLFTPIMPLFTKQWNAWRKVLAAYLHSVIEWLPLSFLWPVGQEAMAALCFQPVCLSVSVYMYAGLPTERLSWTGCLSNSPGFYLRTGWPRFTFTFYTSFLLLLALTWLLLPTLWHLIAYNVLICH